MASIEELLEKLRISEEEKKKLETQNEHLRSALDNITKATQQNGGSEENTTVSDEFSLSNRKPLVEILGRPDEGVVFIDQVLCVAGWVRTMRNGGGGKFAFVELTDGTIFQGLQIFMDSEKMEGFEQVTKDIITGTSIIASGRIVASPGKNQKVEMQAIRVEILGKCDGNSYPLAKARMPLEHLRTIFHLRPRTNTIGAMARVRNGLASATHEFFQKKGFVCVHTPLITASDCEGAGEMFSVTTLMSSGVVPTTKEGKIDYSKDFFKKPAFLTVSGQLNGEMYACALSNIYTFGPTFRAENSNTSRHLAEFWMIEPEIAFADIRENMKVAQDYIKYVLRYVMEKYPQDMAFFENLEQLMLKQKAKENPKAAKDYKEMPLRKRIQVVIDEPFAHITYTQAVEILDKSGVKFEIPCPKWGEDLNSEHERYIAEVVFKKPVIVTDYPRTLKAFYMRANEDNQTVAAMDILVPGVGEIVGGSQREERLDVLEQRIKETPGLDLEAYSAYLDLRRYGSVPHSGFGLGFERLVCYTTGLENIRDAIPFPRYPGHADF